MESVIKNHQKHMRNVAKERSTTIKPGTTIDKILNANGDSLRNLESSEDEEEGEYKDDNKDDTEFGKLSDDDESGWEMGTISNTDQHHMESYRPEQVRLDELSQP